MREDPILSFEDLVQRLNEHSAPSVSGVNLIVPKRPHPFVAQTAIIDRCPQEEQPLDSDVIILTAPAAVGKSTFARALGAQTTLPLLDLAKVRVATHSLRGILSAELGVDSPGRLQRGEFCVIIDALDEGRILSGEKNFEEFLNTTFQLLLEAPEARSNKGPRLLIFGRPAAIELASIVLELEAPDLTVSFLTIDYFDENAAVTLILEHARGIDTSDKVKRFEGPIRQTIKAFFDAIGAAIGSASNELWQDHPGRAFVGYAPVLAALGTLIGREDNYPKLQQRLREAGIADAWGVLQQVADQVLAREAEKVNKPLRNAWGNAVPPEAYDPIDQLELLAAFLTGQPRQSSPRLSFQSAGAGSAYRETVNMHLPEHPFLRDGVPVNEVLGSYVLAHAIAQGVEAKGGQAPGLLAIYGRQPFLWRFCRRLVLEDSIISGDQLSYVLGSFWSDETLGSNKATVEIVSGEEDLALLQIVTPTDSITLRILPPVALKREIRGLTVNLPGVEVIICGWPEADTRSMRCTGDVRILAGTLRFDLERLQVGELSTPSSCHIVAQKADGDRQVTIDVQPNSTLIVGGDLVGRYPWDSVAKTEQQAPSGDPIWDLLADCATRLPGKLPIVVLSSYELTDDDRVEWARRHGDLFPRLLRTLVNHGFAKSDPFPSKEDTKMRVRPEQHWSVLKEAYEHTNNIDQRLQRVLKEL